MTDGKTLIDTVDGDTFAHDPGAGIECGKVGAPKRIWVWPFNAGWGGGYWRSKTQAPETEAGGFWAIPEDVTEARIEVLETKLAKAVGALQRSAREHRVIAGMDMIGASATAYNAARDAEATLAELKGYYDGR